MQERPDYMARAVDQYGHDPFGTILNRTPYFVLPKLAICSMPEDWQMRFAALIAEAGDALTEETPEYLVFRDVTYENPEGIRGVKQVNPDAHDQQPFYRFTGGFRGDPWADYRHNSVPLRDEYLAHSPLSAMIADQPLVTV